MRPRSLLAASAALLALPLNAWAADAPGAVHADPIVATLYLITLVIAAGRLGGSLAVRLGQPEVLGELLAGVALGNLGLLGIHSLERLKSEPALELLAGLGVILLLFEVGLESTVGDMLKVGWSSLLVAIVGVIVPAVLGYAVGLWLLPEAGLWTHLFLATTLCATSVGITARVLQELGRSRDMESRIVLGAAVIDDVLGLLVLAAVSGGVAAAAAGGSVSAGGIARIALVAIAFLAGSLILGRFLAPRLFHVASRLKARGMLQATALGFCFLLAALSGTAGLAPIVGAFAAGLLLEAVHFRQFGERGAEQLEEAMKPVVAWLAPFFFVLMGARVDLATFARGEVLGLSLALTVAAVIGKQVCGLGVLERGLDRLSVGLGMIPRGEVGLIFAQIGHALSIGGRKVIDDATYSAVVLMVMATTMLAPPLLKWSLSRRRPA